MDLYGCDPNTFNRESITKYLEELCDLIEMERADLHFWDYKDYPEEKAKAPVHLVGTSAIQFITTSDIVIHTLDLVEECYINLFTCKKFYGPRAIEFTKNWFAAKEIETTEIVRGRKSKCQV
jgi:S-adenosylmethionine/arginine decarboxylase-like enzyme